MNTEALAKCKPNFFNGYKGKYGEGVYMW